MSAESKCQILREVKTFGVMCNRRVVLNDLLFKGVPAKAAGARSFQEEMVSMNSDRNRAR
jgi:hypothetical protein